MMLTETEQKCNRIYNLVDKLVAECLSYEEVDSICQEINTLCRSLLRTEPDE